MSDVVQSGMLPFEMVSFFSIDIGCSVLEDLVKHACVHLLDTAGVIIPKEAGRVIPAHTPLCSGLALHAHSKHSICCFCRMCVGNTDRHA